jgi:SAM-dependent methyltransferase
MRTIGSDQQPAEWNEFYEKHVLDARFLADVSIWQRRLFGMLLERSAPGQRCLETGSGTGVMSLYLALHQRRVVALDMDRELLKRLHSPLAQGTWLSGVAADLLHLPFRDDSFDMVFSQGVLEHFDEDDFKQGLRDSMRVAPLVVLAFPSLGVKHPLFGNERLRSARRWTELIRPFRILDYRAYDPGGRFARATEEILWSAGGRAVRRMAMPVLDRAFQQLVFVIARS